MGLDVRVRGAEKLSGAPNGKSLDNVDHLASAIVPPARVAFGVFVREDGARRLEHGPTGEVL